MTNLLGTYHNIAAFQQKFTQQLWESLIRAGNAAKAPEYDRWENFLTEAHLAGKHTELLDLAVKHNLPAAYRIIYVDALQGQSGKNENSWSEALKKQLADALAKGADDPFIPAYFALAATQPIVRHADWAAIARDVAGTGNAKLWKAMSEHMPLGQVVSWGPIYAHAHGNEELTKLISQRRKYENHIVFNT